MEKLTRMKEERVPEYNPLISTPLGDEEGVAQVSPRSAI